MNIQELKLLADNKENETIEFKQWKNAISITGEGKLENRSKCLLGYCVAIGNEGGGWLLIGMNNEGDIVGTTASIDGEVKKSIFDKTGQKISIEEIYSDGKKVIVVKIPSRPVGKLLKFAGVPLMRIGESLELMTDEECKRILLEVQDDFSARICNAACMDSIDKNALKKIRELYEKKSNNPSLSVVSDVQLLEDIGLMQKGKLNYSGVILLAKKEFLDLHLANAEICFEYRNSNMSISANERVDYREPFILSVFKIVEKIISRQQVHSFIDGLFRRDIKAFNEEVLREALFNAVCHRDYSQPGSIFIKQSPEAIEMINPGGFPLGINSSNIITAPSTPRNRHLSEIFQKIFLTVERSGQGADKIFRYTIEEGKGMPRYDLSDDYHVHLLIPAMLKDGKFVQYLARITNENQKLLSIQDMLLLEKIREGNKDGIILQIVKHLLEMGFIELHGKTRGARYILARKYYDETGKLGERTRRIGLSREKCKELILEHVRKNKKGTMSEFRQIFPELNRSDISNLVAELKKSRKLEKRGGVTFGAYWVLVI